MDKLFDVINKFIRNISYLNPEQIFMLGTFEFIFISLVVFILLILILIKVKKVINNFNEEIREVHNLTNYCKFRFEKIDENLEKFRLLLNKHLSDLNDYYKNNKSKDKESNENNPLEKGQEKGGQQNSFLDNIVNDFNDVYFSILNGDAEVAYGFREKYKIIDKVGVDNIADIRARGRLDDYENMSLKRYESGYLISIANKDNLSEYLIFPYFWFSKEIIDISGIKIAYDIVPNGNIRGLRVITPGIFTNSYKIIKKGKIEINF